MTSYPFSQTATAFYQTVPVPAPAPLPITTVQNTTTVVASTSISKVMNSTVTVDKPPVTTVFVGNIAETVPDNLIKSLLMRCGNILSWKRIQGVNGKLQAFGFCDYERPESTLRCVRLLNGLKVDQKNLLVKVDSKTEDLLEEYKKKHAEASSNKDDDSVKLALTTILEDHDRVPYSDAISKKPNPSKELDWKTMQDMDLDQDKKELINKEINSFRSKFEGSEEEAKKEEAKRQKISAIGAQAMAFGRVNEAIIRDSNRRRSRSPRSPERRRKAAATGSSINTSTGVNAFSSGGNAKSRRERSRERKIDEEEEIIRRRLARKLKEKEESYQRLLESWESRERKKAMEYDKERERTKKKKEETEAEAERLLEFFDEYDDETEDIRYYIGTALQRRLADRQSEIAGDEKDRQKEIEQLEEARCKLLDSNDPNAETIILQMEQKMQEHLRKRFNTNPEESDSKTSEKILEVAREAIYASSNAEEAARKKKEKTPVNFPMAPAKEKGGGQTDQTFVDAQNEEENEEKALLEASQVKFVPGWIPKTDQKDNLTAEEESQVIAKAAAQLTEEERSRLVKQIIQKIPTDKDSLFAYPIEWEHVNLDFINERIRPWVDKKMLTYLGEVETTLSNFICEQLLNKNTPQKILQDISMVLDDEAEGFVVKMWRLLIYVIAEKKAGLK